MVSVIIPVYNVKSYIDKCMETIMNQTFKEMEIILINDGSTDGSDKKCIEWSKKDNRIVYVSKKNEGLGPTRNLGIKMAKYDYVVFVDSDDWLELNAIEKLYREITKCGADIAYMDFYFSRYNKNNELEEKRFRRPFKIDGAVNVDQMPELICDLDARMWSKMFKRSLFIDNNIEMPAHPYEDFPIMPLLVIYAKSVCQVKEPLYHYYYERPNNLIGEFKNKIFISNGLNELCDSFIKRNLFNKYRKQLERYCMDMTRFAVNSASLVDISKNELDNYLSKFYGFIEKYFPETLSMIELKILSWGSYSNRLIAHGTLFSHKNLERHYCFSSIISSMSNCCDDFLIKHKNKFRENMVKYDVRKTFSNSEESGIKNASYVFIDFLEEINDIIKYENTYFTKSEAFNECEVDKQLEYEVISITNPERNGLWEESCKKFIEYLKKYKSSKQIILLKLKLTENYGTLVKQFKYSNANEIRQINKILDYYYSYFEEHFKGVYSVELNDKTFDYTEQDFEYGCYPYYYNQVYYNNIVDKLIEKIR
ncbi:glycosyltransferase [Clostridium beijerinckii]|uniref:glycosyltransferase n=1 Tax=Clostridium beijerinckii TaxID=1520 RepID=UPI00156EA506|nr:glycosyltransferase [Clostridium beijerinckii]NRT73705.1 glycosyltransferase involved in cell wall biosynthesis [Clostridium beijerinckii]